MPKLIRSIESVAHHRNGVFGAPFHVVLFTATETAGPDVAIVFENEAHCAVLRLNETADGNIDFANGNSWRGDLYEPELRAAIRDWEQNEAETYLERLDDRA